MNDGTQVACMVLEETEDSVLVQTGQVDILIPRDKIDRIERGFSVEFVLARCKISLTRGRRLLQNGKRKEALRIFLAAGLRLSREVRGEKDLPDSVREMLRTIQAARLSALPDTTTGKKAERMYQQAIDLIDHIDYLNAFLVLREASECCADERVDIHLLLAEMAETQGRHEVTLAAYRRILEIDAPIYYEEVAAPMLNLLQRQVALQIELRQSDLAVATYKSVILFQSDTGDLPVSLEVYQEREKRQAEMAEVEILEEVYRQSDSRDLLDLALWSLQEVQALDPENESLAHRVEKAEFLADFKRFLDKGNVLDAAALRRRAEAEFSNVEDRMDALAGDKLDALSSEMKEIDAAEILQEARGLFDRGEYNRAVELALGVVSDYPDQPQAQASAEEFLIKAEPEAEIELQYNEAQDHFERRDYELAAQLLEVTLEIAVEMESLQIGLLEILMGKIPDEIAAREMWDEAKLSMEKDSFQDTLLILEALEKKYPMTWSGENARLWLESYRTRLVREEEHQKLLQTDLLSSDSSPADWREGGSANKKGSLRVMPVKESLREKAWEVFVQLTVQDLEAVAEKRSKWLHIALPFALGMLFLTTILNALGITKRSSRPAAKDVDPGGETCRTCGLLLLSSKGYCSTCGSATQMTEDEAAREADRDRWADFDPWLTRVKAGSVTEYPKYFKLAVELEEKETMGGTFEYDAAIEATRKALREDPHQKDGYKLLGKLYEKVGLREPAQTCYHEVVLLDPEDPDSLKFRSKNTVHPGKPVRIRELGSILLFATWWLIFWIAVGIDPGSWFYRIVLCLTGWVTSTYFMLHLHKETKRKVEASRHNLSDVNHPLPQHRETRRELDARARLIARKISEHIGLRVPALTSTRDGSAIFLSLSLLVSMIYLAWINHMPFLFLGWPVGTLLVFYLLVIEPRVFTAHVMLRHMFTEMKSPWADPHKTFIPSEYPHDVAGEFLVESPDVLPLKWAFHPFPYSQSRHGVIDSLQQTFNRHWACHRFYPKMRVVLNYRLALPGGIKRLTVLVLSLFILPYIAGFFIRSGQILHEKQFEESMEKGYESYLNGDLPAASDFFNRSISLGEERSMPILYKAHIMADMGMNEISRIYFLRATQLGSSIPAVYNDCANFLQRQGNLRDSILHYEKALKLDPSNSAVMNNIGSAHYKLKQYKRSQDYLMRVVRIVPEHARANTTLGLVYEALGEMDAARLCYEHAVEYAARDPYTQVARNRLEDDLREVGAGFRLIELKKDPVLESSEPSLEASSSGIQFNLL